MRTAMELCLMEIASEGMLWEGANDEPNGSYAVVTIDDEARATPCEDSDANDWLQSTSGTTHYVIQWDSNGMTWITEHDNLHAANVHAMSLEFCKLDV